jgi:hypothetical protein
VAVVSATGLPPIPWRYADSPMAKMWFWETEHFLVTVTAEPNSFYWELGDMIQPNDGAPRFLTEGRAADFAAAERAIREAVGKCYHPKLGYGRWAGPLATTFQLANGRSADLGEFEGQRCLVQIKRPDGLIQQIIGYVRIMNYEIELDPESTAPVRIQPAHIVEIRREAGGGVADLGEKQSDYLGVGRLYRGKVVKGCNGTPGYLDGTVDHVREERCPMHEQYSGSLFR